MIDYSVFQKKAVRPEDLSREGRWDVLISGFTQTERVRGVFERIVATEKHWLVFSEYGFSNSVLPKDNHIYRSDDRDEDSYFSLFFNTLDIRGKRICVDITGILRPHILFLLHRLSDLGLGEIDILYSEPAFYIAKERTPFAGEAVEMVRPVRGFEGSPDPSACELLIVGGGYESHLVSALCLEKEPAKKVILIAFPPLRPEMYQESLLRMSEASESLGIDLDDAGCAYFVPANDPFETATIMQQIIRSEKEKSGTKLNIYLCPLATKAQTLAFFVFYECELRGETASILFPFTSTHNPYTSEGLSRVWRYKIEFESFRRCRTGKI